MNVVDSSGWLEYFADGPNAGAFSKPIQNVNQLIVPMVSIIEVFKQVARQRGEGDALQAITAMQQGTVVELTVPVALDAARLGFDERLTLSESIMLATARNHRATLWTQNPHFEHIEGVRYVGRDGPQAAGPQPGNDPTVNQDPLTQGSS